MPHTRFHALGEAALLAHAGDLQWSALGESTGVPASRIIIRHLVPNTLGPVIVYATLTVPSVMLLESFLSFLGLGVQPPTPSWGSILSVGCRGSILSVRADGAVLNRPRRSALYMPGSNARALEKGRTLPADVIILDMEDAVAPDAKSLAREQKLKLVVIGGAEAWEVAPTLAAAKVPVVLDEIADYRFELGRAKMLREGAEVLVIGCSAAYWLQPYLEQRLKALGWEIPVLEGYRSAIEVAGCAVVMRSGYPAGGLRGEPRGGRVAEEEGAVGNSSDAGWCVYGPRRLT